MSNSTETFSESWHRVASRRLALHPSIRVRRQTYRGERFFVLENPFANQFFRLRPAAYEFVARLHRDRTVDEVWRECLELFPDDAPGQGAILQLLGQLYAANLLQYQDAADTSALAVRYEQRRRRELRAQLSNIMFFRLPLFDPDRLLVRLLPLVGRLFSASGVLIWLGVVALALKELAENWDAARDSYQGVLAPGNLPLLYAGMVILKTLHELGHAFACRRFGGEVHTMGVMFMIFTPVPYVDVTSSWSFRSRWQRILVGAAGMIVELFIAALAAVVWVRTSPGTLHSLAYNMMFVAGVTTLVFNLNPLLRFDGYYILTDLLGLPNLGQRANQHLRHVAERHLFGVRESVAIARTPQETGWLTVYGLTSGIYRVFVSTGVLLAVADQYLLLGLVMLFTCALAWVLVPATKFLIYLAASPRLSRVRPRATGVTLLVVCLLIAPLGIIPFPYHFRAPGIVQAIERSAVINKTAGQIARLEVEPGSTVVRGQPLLMLTNHELELDLATSRASLVEMDSRLRQALSDANANLKPLYARAAAITNRLRRLEADQAALSVRAANDGTWIAPDARDFVGRWLPRGTPVGMVVNPAGYEFVAPVVQGDADRLFQKPADGAALTGDLRAEIRVFGQADEVLVARSWHVVPAERDTLPSAALGWMGGGELATSRSDPHGQRAAEPFFEVRVDLAPTERVGLFHGRSGKIRFDLPPKPLLEQWALSLWQLLQRRYQL